MTPTYRMYPAVSFKFARALVAAVDKKMLKAGTRRDGPRPSRTPQNPARTVKSVAANQP